ncbi:copper chaperone CopZ [Arcanobacterium pluranimalium]|uniref:heavy-metal-associated domain-containing protein n=1 Tax=Arcanobacterium pluranimalium TaxID=108028 RepID=UPI0019575A46|nr:heavy-metal-associated domain-containing protein [Arcanobacterium pluranimalium]MBM7824356.1 copper chaperone CopZ [Arcanobacterium pluranimalium]
MPSNIELKVSGMTCGHCAQHVTDELTELNGVSNVMVELEAQGISTVTVITDSDLSDVELREAVAEAGNYTVEEILR